MWSRVLSIAAGLLLLAVGCSSSDDSAATEAPSPEYSQLFDDYIAAWNATDGAAVRSMVTDSYTWEWGDLSLPSSDIEGYVNNWAGTNFVAEIVGEPIWAGSSGEAFVSMAMHMTSDWGIHGPIDMDAIVTLTIDGDDLLVARHVHFATP